MSLEQSTLCEMEVDPFDKLLAGDIFTSHDMQMNLEILCDDLGSRSAGTQAEEKAAEFLKTKLQEYKLLDVHAEPFEYNGWSRGTARLTVTSPWHRELSCLSMPMSPPGRARGKIIDLGTASPKIIETRKDELEGNIALVSIANPPAADRWIHRTEKYNRSILAGARAFIFVGNQDGYGPITGALAFNKWGLIPGIMVSKETGMQLQRLVRRKGTVEAEIETTDTLSKKTSWNITGDVKRGSAGQDMIVVGSHYDGHDISQGAEDPASGVLATLAIARAMCIHADRLKRNVRFILFGVEELGLIGSDAYVTAHAEDIQQTRFMFNLDSAGRPIRKGLTVYDPDSVNYFRAMSQRMNEDIPVDENVFPLREPDHLSDDHYPFVTSGVPCGFIADPHTRGVTGFYHTAHDTVDKVNLLIVKQAAFLCARMAWRVANDDNWPLKRLSSEELARQRTEYDRCEVRQIEKSVFDQPHNN